MPERDLKPWRFQMLGTFEVYRNDVILPGVHRSKECQLLAFLAYTPGRHPRYKLASKFWPRAGDQDNSLSQAMTKLTKVLDMPNLPPQTLLQSSADRTLGLQSHLFTRDTDDFDHLLNKAENVSDAAEKIKLLIPAVKIYRGEFLLGYAVSQEPVSQEAEDDDPKKPDLESNWLKKPHLQYDWIKEPRREYEGKFVQVLKRLASAFRELSLPDLATLCEEHTANATPLSVDECALLERWGETPVVALTASMSFSVFSPASGNNIHARAVASYNEGRCWWKMRAEPALLESLVWFEKALDADLNYVLAYAGMADTYSLLGYYSYMEPKAAVAKAKYWVEEAWRRIGNASDTTRSAVLTADAWIKMIYDWEWISAEEAFVEALQLNPRNETAHQWYSYHLMLRGYTEPSLQAIKTASDLEPQSGIVSKSVGERYHYKRLYTTAIEKYRDALRDAPRYCLTHYCLGKAYEQQALERQEAGLTEEAADKFEEAIGAFGRAIALSDVSQGPQNPALCAGIAHAYAKSGECAKARELLEQLREQRETEGCYVSPVALATVHLGLEEHDAALECLDIALDEHPGDLVLIHIDPRFLGLRQNSRFEEIIRKIGLFY